ncbi:MAG TPA: sigma-54 dependent transcriptional regulator [Gemmatimonadaceae bacterium]|nr:sigma-54 dependent transcriptional regulator [Gemmatimonadaceae bacterium]
MSVVSDAPRSYGLSAPGLADVTLHNVSGAKSTISVLVVDDDRALREGCASFLQAEGYNASLVGSGDEALERVKRRRFDLILLDLYMSQVSGLEILRAALETNRDTLVVVMTGNPSVESSLEARHLGAWDYLLKPFTPTHLDVLLGRATHAILTMREIQGASARLTRESGNSELVTCIGVSRAFRHAVELARKVALTDASVMITGESGTGKEVLAQVIHRHGRRANRKLVPVNCAALPEPLLESEMFGHRRGAFTGADRDKPGLLETANGGTLFLDELTEMSQSIQAKLLRVLQDGVVRRLGSEEQDAVVDVRIISATNSDPKESVRKGVLREDLYYRLRVVPIHLPPLRERVEDIPILARHFLRHFWDRHHRRGTRCPELAAETIDFLQSRPWRGNVRELQNVIEHLAVLAEPGQTLQPDDLPATDEVGRPLPQSGLPSSVLNEGYHSAKERLITDFEKEYLTRLVLRAGGNMSKAARLASMDRTTLYRLMEKHRIHRDDMDAPVF